MATPSLGVSLANTAHLCVAMGSSESINNAMTEILNHMMGAPHLAQFSPTQFVRVNQVYAI